GIQLPPGDRRLVMTTGPFVMALGDTQDVVLASLAGMGQDNISSVTVLKFYDTFAQYAYDNDFILPSPPPTPSVEATGLDGRIILNWGENTSDYMPTETHESFGFVFEGYNVYQLPTSTSGLAEAEKVATFDEINLIQSIFDPGVDPNSGFVLDQLKQQGTNSGIQRYFSTDRDAVRDRPMSNANPYYFAVTAYSYLTDNIGSPFKTLESSPNVIAVFPDVPLPGDELGEEYGEGQITTTHTGTADGDVEVMVVSPPDLVGADYEVFFNAQHYYRDVDGIWKETNYPDSVGKNLDKGMDVSASTVTIAALAAEDVGTVDLTFTFELESATGEWVDGFRLDLPDGLTINSATATGAYCSYPEYGQLCENIPDGLIHPGTNTIMWGDSSRSGFGGIDGDMTFTVNVDLFTFPMTAVYQVYDDGYGTATVDAIGTVTATELGYEFLTLEHWNLRNLTSGEVVLEDMAFMDGEDIYDGDYGDDSYDSEFIGVPAGPIVEGIQINVSVGYAAPEDFGTLTEDGDGDYDIDSYLANSWAASALASDPDTWGCGTADIGILQRDLEVRFTGVYADPETTVTGVDTLIYHPIEDGTGSIATIVGSRLYDLDVHPLNPTGTDAHFTVRIPFEVWDLDADGGPEQIDIIIYDREQEPTGAGGGFAGDFYVFNPAGRMYCHFLHRPYSEDVADVGEEGGLDDAGNVACGTEGDLLSWNTVWWETDWVTGDVLTFQYDNPIQLGTDVWTFSTTAPTLADEDLAKEAVEMINVYPNPYYGYHALETSRQGKWVKFTHLPPASISEVTVRIFDLGGAMVRVLHKDDETQYLQWNLRNQSGYPVASGIYIIHIDLPGLGKSKVLKLAIVQEEQILTRY
ncbi:MAG: T9SS type A sorting domain-containing protein, partial [Fidelibacterota bacterium]